MRDPGSTRRYSYCRGLDGKALNSATILPLTGAKLLALGAVDRQPSFWLLSVKLTHAKQLKLALMGLIPAVSPLCPIEFGSKFLNMRRLNRFYRLRRLISPLPSISGLLANSMAWKRSSVRSRPGPPISPALCLPSTFCKAKATIGSISAVLINRNFAWSNTTADRRLQPADEDHGRWSIKSPSIP